MAGGRRAFSRKPSIKAYRKLYIIATEGAETEPAYFNMFQSKDATIRVKILGSQHASSPKRVLKKAELFVARVGLKKSDSVWLVLDRDTWQEEELDMVWQGCQKNNFNLAVSNPCFEYWLLLHFEKGSGISSTHTCLEKLAHHLPHFAKGHVEIEKLRPNIRTAIAYAVQKDVPPCMDWPRTKGSTVYKLVQELTSMEGIRNS
ncbi:MAG: RloB family protein [Desulfocapsaceae bacterium]|nr:RloB family protein [Desulfocapsaceae bacterium]